MKMLKYALQSAQHGSFPGGFFVLCIAEARRLVRLHRSRCRFEGFHGKSHAAKPQRKEQGHKIVRKAPLRLVIA